MATEWVHAAFKLQTGNNVITVTAAIVVKSIQEPVDRQCTFRVTKISAQYSVKHVGDTSVVTFRVATIAPPSEKRITNVSKLTTERLID